jgi:DNA mismatch repair protein MutS2
VKRAPSAGKGPDPLDREDPARLARLEQFAARALDFADVLANLERHASTSLGLRALRALAPLDDDGARAALQRATEARLLVRHGGAPSLAGVTDPLPPLEHARRAGRALEDVALVQLRDFLEACGRLAAWLRTDEGAAPALGALASGMPDFTKLLERIAITVDERGRVRDSASPLLARLRRELSETGSAIERALKGIVARPEVKAVLSDPVTHRRGGRAVLAVKSKSQGRVPGIVHDRSQSDQTVFIEPREVVALGNRRAEFEADERRELERVLLEITRALLAEEEPIREGAERVAKLELALIAANYAAESGGALLRIAGDGAGDRGLVLRAARHPLLVEQRRTGKLGDVVAIDLRIGADFDLLILTGPNTGGKTLALKTAGLAAVMARCGLPFPCAEGSCIPLYDGIVADIGDEQEIRSSLSTFSSHLARIKNGLARGTAQSLFLLDELGTGTDPDEGAALSEAILEELLARKCATLASTHIGKLKEFAFRNPRAENACVEFDPKTMSPRYKVLVGVPGESSALLIARRLGLPYAVCDRAEQRLKRRDVEVQKLMADVRTARTEAEKVRGETERRLLDAERAARETEVKQAEVTRKGEMLEAEAQRSIEDRVREARARVARIEALLEQVPASQRNALETALRELDGELSGAAVSDRRQAFLDALVKGSYVYLPRYKQRVPVQKVDRSKREVKVMLGAIGMTVSFDEVTSVEAR